MSHHFRLCFACLAITFCPLAVQAHPGHGHTDQGITHYVGEPVHAMPLGTILLTAALAAAVLFAVTLKRRQNGESNAQS